MASPPAAKTNDRVLVSTVTAPPTEFFAKIPCPPDPARLLVACELTVTLRLPAPALFA